MMMTVDSQQKIDIVALQYWERRCVVGEWRGNIDSGGHLCVQDTQHTGQDAWLTPMAWDGLGGSTRV
jgi:hypothetical protein